MEPLYRIRIEGSSTQESSTSWVFVSFTKQSDDKKETVRKWVFESTLLAAYPNTPLPDELSSLTKRLSMEADVSKESSLKELQQVSQSFEAYKKRTKAATLLLQERNEEATSQITKLQQELHDTQTQLTAIQQHVQQQSDDSNSAVQTLQSQLAESTERLNALEASKRELEQTLADREASLSAKSKEIDELNAVVEAEQDLNDSRERDVEELRGTVKQLRSEISQLIQKTAESSVKSLDSQEFAAETPSRAVTMSEEVAAAMEEPSEGLTMPTAVRKPLRETNDARLNRFFCFLKTHKKRSKAKAIGFWCLSRTAWTKRVCSALCRA